jgi:hypothetical protein
MPSRSTRSTPQLKRPAKNAIFPDNIRVAEVIYVAWLLEQLRVFDVTERIVEMFQQGLLRLAPGATADRLRYFETSDQRLSAVERKQLYCRLLGCETSDERVQVNAAFASLWLAFLAAVATFAVPGNAPLLRDKAIKAAALALARNISTQAAGTARLAARQLAAEVRRVVDLLSTPEIGAAFGAPDMWQVIKQVSSNELGGAVSAPKHRTLGRAATKIFDWLARRAHGTVSLNCAVGIDGTSDRDLVNAATRWITGSASTTDAAT